ncbi:MAG: hypothetical protein NTV54_09575 [Ignavibacteriales bacterium]|nr:hypothetical protein [Ignavibacteriales bacterium]
MIKKFTILGFFIVCSLLYAQPQPPFTAKIPKTFTEHGSSRTDDYFWLNNPRDTAVLSHLRAENAYVESMMKHTEALQKTIYDELVARIEQKYESLPVKKNGYWYYERYEEGKQYPLYCRKKEMLSALEEIFLDVNALAKGHQIFMVRGYSVSRDNLRLVYGVDTAGDRRCVAYVKNLVDGAVAKEVLANTSGAYEWANDNATIVYVVNDPTVRPYQARRHRLGTDPKDDAVVYTEKDSTFGVGLSSTRHNERLIITSGSTLSTECRFLDADHPDQSPILIQPRKPDILYSVAGCEGKDLFLLTNRSAKNFKLVKAPLSNPVASNWTDIIPHNTKALLENAVVFKNYIVAQQKMNALSHILIMDRSTRSSYPVDFREQAFVAAMSAATDADDLDSIRYTYTSLTQPETEYWYNLRTKERKVLKKAAVGGGYDESLYETKRIWAPARDGAKVPVTIVYKKKTMPMDRTVIVLILRSTAR